MTAPARGRSWWATLRWIAIPVFMVGGLALFGFLVHLSGPARVLAEIVRMGPVGFLAVIGSVVAAMLTWSLSWYTLLRGAGAGVPWRGTVSPLLAGFAVTYVTPSAYLGGEPVRAYWIAHDQGIPMARVIATVVVERILAGFSLLAFASIGGWVVIASPAVPLADRAAVGIALGALALFLTALLVPLARNVRWLSRFLRWLSRYLPGRERVLRAADHVAEMEREAHQAFTRYRGYTLLAFAFQLLTVFLHYIRPQLFFYFTQRDPFTFPQLSLYFTLNLFVDAFLWISPGGFGVTDGGRVMIFTLLGIPASGGLAFAVVYRFVDLFLVGWGVQLLVRRGLLKWRRGRVTVSVDRAPPDQ